MKENKKTLVRQETPRQNKGWELELLRKRLDRAHQVVRRYKRPSRFEQTFVQLL